MRLFLFLENAAFVIAADTEMIKHAVRRHFDGVDDDLVTNYFDKLIQVPIRVPPLGTQEVRAYMMLLFVENSGIGADDQARRFAPEYASSLGRHGRAKGLTARSSESRHQACRPICRQARRGRASRAHYGHGIQDPRKSPSDQALSERARDPDDDLKRPWRGR